MQSRVLRQSVTSGTEFRKLDKNERQIRYYIRLTNLIDALLNKVDEGMVSIKVGAEKFYLNVPLQGMVNDYIDSKPQMKVVAYSTLKGVNTGVPLKGF